MSAEEKVNFMPERYRDKYRGDQDWLGNFINANCRKVLEEGKAAQLCLDSLMILAEVNAVDAKDVSYWRKQFNKPGAPGRIRMTIGNMLRARAKRRHGLLDLEGNWVEADAEFIGDARRTEESDGSPSEEVLKEREAKKAEQAAKKAEREAEQAARRAEQAAKKAEQATEKEAAEKAGDQTAQADDAA